MTLNFLECPPPQASKVLHHPHASFPPALHPSPARTPSGLGGAATARVQSANLRPPSEHRPRRGLAVWPGGRGPTSLSSPPLLLQTGTATLHAATWACSLVLMSLLSGDLVGLQALVPPGWEKTQSPSQGLCSSTPGGVRHQMSPVSLLRSPRCLGARPMRYLLVSSAFVQCGEGGGGGGACLRPAGTSLLRAPPFCRIVQLLAPVTAPE